jgi:seryl-tRNA synthetase
MPIDINFLRKDRGGDPDFWRENQRKRFCDPGLVDLVLSLDEVWLALHLALCSF